MRSLSANSRVELFTWSDLHDSGVIVCLSTVSSSFFNQTEDSPVCIVPTHMIEKLSSDTTLRILSKDMCSIMCRGSTRLGPRTDFDMGDLVYYYDVDWNKPAILLPGAEKWQLIDKYYVDKGLVADLSGQQMMFLDVANHWISLVSHTAALRVSQVIGNDNVSVSYGASYAPYYSKMAKACNSNSVSFVPASICVGTKRLGIEYNRKTRTLNLEPVDPLPLKRSAGVPPFVYSLCYLPTDHIDIPMSYEFPGIGSVLNFLYPLFPDKRRMITYMWLLGNAIVDPISRPRCMMLVGPGGAGKSTALRMAMAALSGASNLIADNILVRNYESLNDKVAQVVIKSRLVTCFELDLVNNDINMSVFKNITGNDFVRSGEFMSRAACSFAIATNGLHNVVREPEFMSDALSRRMVCIKMDVDTSNADFELDPSISRDKMDFLCACAYTRMKYSHLPITPEDLIITLAGTLYPKVMRYIREERSRPVEIVEGRAVISIIAGILSTSARSVVDRCKLISLLCIDYTPLGYVIKGLVPINM